MTPIQSKLCLLRVGSAKRLTQSFDVGTIKEGLVSQYYFA
jgi:hypothetical protein